MLQKQPGINAVPTTRDVKIAPKVVLGLTEVENNIIDVHDN